MGIDTGCSLVVGLPYPELVKDCERVNDGSYADDIGLDAVYPYFDCERECQIWGVTIESDYWRPVPIDIATLPAKVTEAAAKFRELTGLEGRLFMSANVT